MKFPFNVRSFFTPREAKDIGGGLELWRGYFQSVRPAPGRMLINMDIATGAMYAISSYSFIIDLLMQTHRYKAGPLLHLCLGFINKDHPSYLAPTRGFPDRERLKLQRFISGMRIITTSAGPNGTIETARVIKKLSGAGADRLTFQQDGRAVTVADYYRLTRNRPLQFPDVLCVEVSLCV